MVLTPLAMMCPSISENDGPLLDAVGASAGAGERAAAPSLPREDSAVTSMLNSHALSWRAPSLGCELASDVLQQADGLVHQIARLFGDLKIGFVAAVGLAQIGKLDKHVDVRQLDESLVVGGRVAGVLLDAVGRGIAADFPHPHQFDTGGAVERVLEGDGLARIGIAAGDAGRRLRVGDVL